MLRAAHFAGLMLCLGLAAIAGEALFESRSKELAPEGRMDIVVREVERNPRSSVIRIEIRDLGSSVGSSFFLLCSVRKLAKARGAGLWIAMLEEHPAKKHSIIAFLQSGDEDPAAADERLRGKAATKVIELEQFAPICDRMGK